MTQARAKVTNAGDGLPEGRPARAGPVPQEGKFAGGETKRHGGAPPAAPLQRNQLSTQQTGKQPQPEIAFKNQTRPHISHHSNPIF